MDAACTCAIESAHTIIKHNMVDLLILIGFIVVNCIEWNVFGNQSVFSFAVRVCVCSSCTFVDLFRHFVRKARIKKQSEINNRQKRTNE